MRRTASWFKDGNQHQRVSTYLHIYLHITSVFPGDGESKGKLVLASYHRVINQTDLLLLPTFTILSPLYTILLSTNYKTKCLNRMSRLLSRPLSRHLSSRWSWFNQVVKHFPYIYFLHNGIEATTRH